MIYEDKINNKLMEEGLLSPIIEEHRPLYIKKFKELFDLAYDLNRFSMKIYLKYIQSKHIKDDKIFSTVLHIYARSINSFASAITLAERAFSLDAASCSRPIYEAGFWLAYFAINPKEAFDAFEQDHINQAINHKELIEKIIPQDTELIAALNKKIQSREKKKTISIKDLANKLDKAPGYIEYRIASNFYGHVSVDNIQHMQKHLSQEQIIQILGPHVDEIPQALAFIIASMVHTSIYFDALVNNQEYNKKLKDISFAMHQFMEKNSSRRRNRDDNISSIENQK